MSELNALFETQISSVMSNMVRENAFRLDANCYNSATASCFWKSRKLTAKGRKMAVEEGLKLLEQNK